MMVYPLSVVHFFIGIFFYMIVKGEDCWKAIFCVNILFYCLQTRKRLMDRNQINQLIISWANKTLMLNIMKLHHVPYPRLNILPCIFTKVKLTNRVRGRGLKVLISMMDKAHSVVKFFCIIFYDFPCFYKNDNPRI